jgi:GNAT superfamily N-acetyltransferase
MPRLPSMCEDAGVIEIQELPPERIDLLGEIDRSEHIDQLYEATGGVLASRCVAIDVPAWDTSGSGPHSVTRLLADMQPVLARSAVLLGASATGDLAGIAVVEERYEGTMAWLALLHVSRPHRRRGVATALWDESVTRGRLAGATSMYVSATPSTSAVGFYLSRGCQVPSEPRAELFAKEPEDIHLIYQIAEPRT